MKPDPGHEATDELLEEMERKIRRTYRQAVTETTEKLDDYLRRFEIKDEKWRLMVASGEKTAEEYQKWRTGQIMMGERWEAMRDQLAADYHNANVIARSIIAGYMPEAYAINMNYAAWEIESGLGIDTGFTLYDRATVERILRDDPDLLQMPGQRMNQTFADFDAYRAGQDVTLDEETKKAFDNLIAGGKDVRWQKGQIQSVTMQSILQGESIPNMAKRIAQTMGELNHKSTIRYARTAMTGAQNAGRVDGYKRAQDMGIELEQQWIATLDNRTRHSHRQLDGETVEVGGTFSNGCKFPGDPDGPASEIWNCFVGETKIASDSEIVRSYKHKYTGDLIVIKSAGGVEFTCTPNHPILTPRGWVSANALNKGDNILVTFVGEFDVSWVDPDINHILPSMKAFHKFMNGFSAERASGLSVDFHGDRATANVEIISKKRLLRRDIKPCGSHASNKVGFKDSCSLIFCKRHFVASLRRIYIAAFGLMCGACKPLALFRGRLRHAKVHRLGSVAGTDFGVSQYAIDNLPAATMIRRELLNGLSGHVFVDNITSADTITGCTHVYNLQTENGYYFVNESIAQSGRKSNGIMAIAKNCRCTLIANLKGFERDISSRWREGMEWGSYEEWKAEHGKNQSITHQEEIGEAMRKSWINFYRGRRR